MLDPTDRADQRPPQLKRGPRRRGLGCLLTGVALVLVIEIFGGGIGFPNTYWLEFSEIQAFDGDDGVVLFVQVERRMRYAGPLRSPPIHKAAELLRIDVASDGRFRRTSLGFADGVTFNSRVDPILGRLDGFYVIEDRRIGRSPRRIHRVLDNRIEPLDEAESIRLLQEMGFRSESSRVYNSEEFDQISAHSGWRRLNGSGEVLRWKRPIILSRHGLRFRIVEGDQTEAIVAEPISGTESWSKTLAEVSTKRWKSYRSPLQ